MSFLHWKRVCQYEEDETTIDFCFDAGYHVLCEKLMGCSVEECEAMIAAQKKSEAKLMIAYRLHCDPGNVEVLERVRKGDFGEPRIFSSMHTQFLRPENHRAKHGQYSS